MLYLVYCTLGILCGYGRIVFSKAIAYDQRQTGDVNVQIHVKDVQIVALVDTDLIDDYTDYDYAYDYADFTLKPILKPTTTTVSTPSASPMSSANALPTSPANASPTSSPNASPTSPENASPTSSPNASPTSSPNASTSDPPSASTSSTKPWTTWPTNKPSSTSSTTELTVDVSKLNFTEAQTSTTLKNAQESTIISTTQRGSTIESNNDDSTREKNETSVKLTINEQAGNRVIVDEQDLVKINRVMKTTTTSKPSSKNNKACTFPYVADKKGRCRSLNNRRRISLVPLTMRLGSRLTKKGHTSLQKDLPIRIFKYDTSQ